MYNPYLLLVKSFNSERNETEDQKCNYHENFRLYLITKQTNPIISTSVCSNMTVINCSITQKASIHKYTY